MHTVYPLHALLHSKDMDAVRMRARAVPRPRARAPAYRPYTVQPAGVLGVHVEMHVHTGCFNESIHVHPMQGRFLLPRYHQVSQLY